MMTDENVRMLVAAAKAMLALELSVGDRLVSDGGGHFDLMPSAELSRAFNDLADAVEAIEQP